MSDTKRTILAGLLIGFLTLCIPFYLRLIGIMPESSDVVDETLVQESETAVRPASIAFDSPVPEALPSKPVSSLNEGVILFSVVSDKYQAQMSSVAGGSFVGFTMSGEQKDGYKYVGGYNDLGEYDGSINLDLVLAENNGCSPCVTYDNIKADNPFRVLSPSVYSGQVFNLYDSDSLVFVMEGSINGERITKKTTFYADNYIIKHDYVLPPLGGPTFVLWDSGVRATEKNLYEELTYAQAYVGQSKEIGDIYLSPSGSLDVIEKETFSGKTDWVAIRNKYFINALVSQSAVGGTLEARSFQLNNENFIPVYSVALKFNSPSASVSQFFGPLDVDIISSSGTYLDRVMNFGWLPIQPFSRSVLWILKKLHLLGINYGIILILFAFMIRVITGPLTKKSYQSTQKMQTIQPQMKKIQEKYKNDSQRLNREMMNLYKDSGVNPLGGCLPMLIQMPLLFSLFIVFRSTIEFRGAPFFWWINNLSQPDTIFNLPFNIPIYGNQVAFLPIVLGISMFMTQKLSMATMDKNQKPMMYMMSAFFFLLFNSFPSGLNLYYTVYNFLNYFQQRSIKAK